MSDRSLIVRRLVLFTQKSRYVVLNGEKLCVQILTLRTHCKKRFLHS